MNDFGFGLFIGLKLGNALFQLYNNLGHELHALVKLLIAIDQICQHGLEVSFFLLGQAAAQTGVGVTHPIVCGGMTGVGTAEPRFCLLWASTVQTTRSLPVTRAEPTASTG